MESLALKTVQKTLRLTSPEGFGSRVPPLQFGHVLELITPSVRQAVRMAFQGRSAGRGRRPDWLTAASDIRFVGFSGTRDTVLAFEAPRLGDAAADLYEQQEFEFADTRPPRDLTAIDLFAGVLDDVTRDNKDSSRFDRHLLNQITRFGPAFGNAFESLAVGEKPDSSVLNRETIKLARLLRIEIPKPRRVRVIGTLDMIRASTNEFGLHLDDKSEVRAVQIRGNVDGLAAFLRKRVMVDGRAVYRPSGRVLRIDAEQVISGENQPGIWSHVPPPLNRHLRLRDLRKPQTPSTGLGAIVGKWPGNETDAEMEKALQELA